MKIWNIFSHKRGANYIATKSEKIEHLIKVCNKAGAQLICSTHELEQKVITGSANINDWEKFHYQEAIFKYYLNKLKELTAAH